MAELDEITKRRDGARAQYDALRKKRLAMFSEGFFTIKMKLKEMYRMLTLGGDAELEQVSFLLLLRSQNAEHMKTKWIR